MPANGSLVGASSVEVEVGVPPLERVAEPVAEAVVEVPVALTRLGSEAPHCFPEKQRVTQSWLLPQLLAQTCLLCMHRLYGMVKEYLSRH